MKKLIHLLVIIAILTVAVGCGGTQETATKVKRASWPTQSWQTSTPEQQDMDPEKLNQLIKYIQDNNLKVDSVLVVRHGYIVKEEYFSFIYDETMLHTVNSITKSVLSSLVGIALKEKYIKSLDYKMVDFFPERTIQNLDDRKKSVTLEHMLSMTVGMEWNEWEFPYSDPNNAYVKATRARDPIQYILDQPMAVDPGTVWAYNGGCSQLLSAIITKNTGLNTLEFARKYLFTPLGITNSDWTQDTTGLYNGGGGLYLTPRDMAKFGYLYLNNGVWNGKQIVPEDFVKESVKTQHSFSAAYGYGWESWWTYPQNGFYDAAGLNGQRIYIHPELDLVVVYTANMPEDSSLERHMFTMMTTYIIPACK